MKKNLIQVGVVLCISLLTSSAFAQQKFISKYFPITKITKKPGVILIECIPDHHNNDIKVFAETKLQKGIPIGTSGNKTLKNLPVLKGDSLMVYARNSGTGKKCGNISFAIIKFRVIDNGFQQRNIIEYELRARPGACVIKMDDMIELQVKNGYDDSMLLFRIANYNIGILAADNTPLFPRLYRSSSPEQPAILRFYNPMEEMSIIKSMLADLKDAADFYKDKYTTPITMEGPFAGKTPSEVFYAATEKDIINFLNYVASYPRDFMGNQYKLTEIYGTWIIIKQYPGTIPNLKILSSYNQLVKMKSIFLDVDKGTLNGTALKTVMENWLGFFPVYDGDEKGSPKNTNPFYQYDLAGNCIKFDVKEKSLAVWDRHQGFAGNKYMGLTAKQVIAKLGKPALSFGDTDAPDNLFFERPYGTLHIFFGNEYDDGLSTYFTLHLVKPGQINVDKYK